MIVQPSSDFYELLTDILDYLDTDPRGCPSELYRRVWTALKELEEAPPVPELEQVGHRLSRYL